MTVAGNEYSVGWCTTMIILKCQFTVAEQNTILPISMPNLIFSRNGKCGGKI
jgi:hypothetical protein